MGERERENGGGECSEGVCVFVCLWWSGGEGVCICTWVCLRVYSVRVCIGDMERWNGGGGCRWLGVGESEWVEGRWCPMIVVGGSCGG